MNYARLLIKKIFNTSILLHIRNSIGFCPSRYSSFKNIKNGSSISDAFCWRTDQNFITTFKYTDIPKLFFDIENSHVEIFIHSKNNILLKKLTINKLQLSNEIIIDKSFLNGLESYGSFYVFHKYKQNKNDNDDFSINNRCYTAYSKNGNLKSFVHGNLPAFHNNGKDEQYFTDIVKNTVFKNQMYIIQNNFNEYDKTELFFNNPTSQKISITVNVDKFYLDPHCSKLLHIKKTNKICIRSNSYFIRPIVFNYKNNYYDVYHS